jgi:hypothetical protein
MSYSSYVLDFLFDHPPHRTSAGYIQDEKKRHLTDKHLQYYMEFEEGTAQGNKGREYLLTLVEHFLSSSFLLV